MSSGEVCCATSSGLQKSENNEKTEVKDRVRELESSKGRWSGGAGGRQSEPVKSSALTRKRFARGAQAFVADQYEDCDCLEEGCPGCHFPCKNCGDARCGKVCRKGRKWLYKSVEVEGRGVERRNPHSDY